MPGEISSPMKAFSTGTMKGGRFQVHMIGMLRATNLKVLVSSQVSSMFKRISTYTSKGSDQECVSNTDLPTPADAQIWMLTTMSIVAYHNTLTYIHMHMHMHMHMNTYTHTVNSCMQLPIMNYGYGQVSSKPLDLRCKLRSRIYCMHCIL